MATTDPSSANRNVLDELERKHAAYLEKVQASHFDNFPATHELEERIEAAELEHRRHMAEYRSVMAEAEKEKEMLPALEADIRAAIQDKAMQLGKIELLMNK